MSQETQKYKLKEYNFATDSTQDFVNGVAGVSGNGSKSNMQIIEDEIDRVDNKVKLDGATQTNFNFIPNEVVQDGLLYMNNDVNSNKVDTSVIDGDCIYISARAKAVNVGTVFFPFGNHKSSFPFTGFALQVNKNGENKVQLYISLEDGTRLTSVVSINIDTSLYNDYTLYKNGKMITLIVNNKIVYSAILEKNYAKSPINIYLGVVNGDSNANCITTNAVIYNRQLTPQEFEHNLQVFNSPPSLTLLETTSSDGTKVKHLFHSDSQVVSMRDERTLNEFANEVLDWEEKTADASGKIEVGNCKRAWLRNFSIEGNSKVFKRVKGSTGEWVAIANDESRDTTQFDYKLESTQAIISNVGMKSVFYEPIVKGLTKVLKTQKGTQNWIEISCSEVRDTTQFDYRLESVNSDLGSVPSVKDYVDGVKRIKYVNTKGIVVSGNENWLNFSIEPKGLARMNLRIDDAINTKSSEVIPIVSDKVVAVKHANSWANVFDCVCIHPANRGIILYLEGVSTSTEFKNKIKSNPITVRYQVEEPIEIQLTEEEARLYNTHNNVISLGGTPTKKDKLELKEDGSGIITYNTSDLEDGSSRVDLATPITTHIPKELMSVIATQQTNNLSVDSPVQPSSFKAIVPVDKVAILETELKRIASIVDTPKNIALLDNYVEDEYNKNQKEEGVM